jgi:ABC-type bacteriocin/lantibiotic exporter with double-glycine peptidase domain
MANMMHGLLLYYPFWIILVTILFSIVLIALLYSGTRDKGKLFKRKCRYAKTITLLSSYLISIKQGVNVIHYFGNHTRVHKSWNTQFNNGGKKQKAILIFADYSCMGSG